LLVFEALAFRCQHVRPVGADRCRDLSRRDEHSKLLCRSILANKHALPSQSQFPGFAVMTARVTRACCWAGFSHQFARKILLIGRFLRCLVGGPVGARRFFCARSMLGFSPTLRAFVLHGGKIREYPLLDVIPSLSKGRNLLLVTSLRFRRITETMLEVTFRLR